LSLRLRVAIAAIWSFGLTLGFALPVTVIFGHEDFQSTFVIAFIVGLVFFIGMVILIGPALQYGATEADTPDEDR